MPRLSVIAIAYRAPDFLNQALASVAAQDFRDLELIVVDDASGDDLVARYELPTGARLIRHRQRGGAAAKSRNTGLRAASGELIAFLDQDDAWRPGHLAAAVAALETDPEVGLACTHPVVTDEHLHPLAKQPRFRGLPPKPGLGSARERTLRAFLGRNWITTPSSVVTRRTALDAASPDPTSVFDEPVTGASDRDLWLRLASVSRLVALPAPLTLYRTHPDQLHRDEPATRPGRLAFHEKTLTWAAAERPDLLPLARRAFVKTLKKCAARDPANREKYIERARLLGPFDLGLWIANHRT
jgi:glycosyltransferase involved in cell wall biosynthesis